MRRHLFAVIATITSAALAACEVQGGESTSICQQAADHYADCTGEASVIGETCDPVQEQLAEQILNASCTDLTTSEQGDGKSDAAGAITTCIALVFPLLVIRSQGEGAACCVPYNCKSGLTCHTDTFIPTCGAPRPAGGTCADGWQCASGLTCVAKKCAPPLAAGQACGEGECQSGLVCARGTCSAPLAAGAACDEGDCAGDLACVFGTCEAPRAEGYTCAANDDCGAGLLCQNGTCAVQSCDESQFSPCGTRATCYGGQCEPLHAAGETCRNMFDCQFGLFCDEQAHICHAL
ncbi:MAG TPA: hypothetical protein VFU21_25430 [Kofleriaceae bacterium]|nr:hypothetical protein [Kofleriaceae bacterium]